MTPDDMRSAIEQQLRAWVRGDAETLVAGFMPEGEIVVPGKAIRGHESLRAAVNRYSGRHRDVRVVLHRMVFGKDCASVEYRWEDTKIETGARYVADDSVWVDFENGLIRRWREYWDDETPRAARESDA